MRNLNVYIAGPLFTRGQRLVLEEIDQIVQHSGHSTYLPHRDAGLFKREADSSRVFFENDVLRLADSDLVIAVLDGSDVDSGTSWEAGFAFARDIPIIGYADDTRLYDPSRQLNPMIVNCLWRLVRDHLELETGLAFFTTNQLVRT